MAFETEQHGSSPGRHLGVILGSSAQQDGASASLTAPNGSSQRRLYGSVLAQARAKAGEASCLEAHGTGTDLGDPIEVGSAVGAFETGRGPSGVSSALMCGSLKSNGGHMECVAAGGGLASATHVALARVACSPSAQLRTRNHHLASLMVGACCHFGSAVLPLAVLDLRS